MKNVTRYQADDGREFSIPEECELYERDKDAHALIGLDVDAMTDILDGIDGTAETALAIERLGRRLATARQKRGEKLRGGNSEDVVDDSARAEKMRAVDEYKEFRRTREIPGVKSSFASNAGEVSEDAA